MLDEATFPLKYIKGKYDVTDEFISWLKPLVNEVEESVSFLN